MKLAETELKQLITIFLRLSWGINTVEQCFESIGVSVTIGNVSPLDIGRLGDFVLDMFEVPRDTGDIPRGQTNRFYRDWFYMTIYGHTDIELTEDTLELRTNEIYNFLSDWKKTGNGDAGNSKEMLWQHG